MSAPTEPAHLEQARPAEEETLAVHDDQHDEGFELLWSKVQEHWEDDKVHAAFLEYARGCMLLPEAGARYRVIKENDPLRAEMAQKKLAMLMLLALSLLESAREPVTGTPKWITSIAYAVAAVFLAVLIAKALGGR